jgi:hypothetical protein
MGLHTVTVYIVYRRGTFLHTHDYRIGTREMCERIALAYGANHDEELFSGRIAVMIRPYTP